MSKLHVNVMAFANLIEALLDGVYSCQELADICGLNYNTVTRHTSMMHSVGALHICEWRFDSQGREAIKVYRMGRGEDAPRKVYGLKAEAARARRREKIKRLGAGL